MGKFKLAPYILIGLGAVFLLNNFGLLPWSIWINMWKFWPLVLVIIGLEFILGKAVSPKILLLIVALIFLAPILLSLNLFSSNPLASEKLEVREPLNNIARAKLVINLPAANLELNHAATDSANLVESEIVYSKASDKPQVSREENFGEGIVTIEQPTDYGIPSLSIFKEQSRFSLNQRVPFEIQIKNAASKQKLDFSQLRIDELILDTKASDIEIIFGALYSSRAVIKTSASNINILIPKEIDAKVKIDSKVKNLSIPDRFRQQDGEYKTDGFDKAFTKIELEIEAVASNITIN